MTTDTPACEPDRPLRADAARNRELILETAADVFAEHGLDAGYDEIARRAGIGVGTVYRRFPERRELVQALFESRVDEMVTIAETAASGPSAWDGLVSFMGRMVERQVADRGLKEVMASTISADAKRSIGQQRLGPIIDDLVARAKAEGTLRADVAATDIGMHLMAMSAMTTSSQPNLWERYLALLLDGLRAHPDQAPLPHAPPTDDAMHEVVCHLHGR